MNGKKTQNSTLSSFWPIFPHEYKKIIPMLLMVFCICFSHSMLRTLKDSLVVTESGARAAAIPFIKTWVMLPTAIAFTMFFTFLSNRLSRTTVFYIIIASFLSFFLLFGFILYPNCDALEPTRLSNFLDASLPQGFKALISIFRHWPQTLFYAMAETWGSIVLSVLFWGFANEITTLSEAPRFYSVLSIGASTAPIVAGQVAASLSAKGFNPDFLFGETAWHQALSKQILLITFSGFLVILCFNWITRHVLDKSAAHVETDPPKKEEKHLNFRESLSYIAHSKYLLCIATLVLSYNLVIALVEIVWKDRLGLLYPSAEGYNIYVNNLTSIMGVVSIAASFLLIKLLSRFGWTLTALLTPIVLLVTSVLFFITLIGNEAISPVIMALFGMTPLAFGVLLGAIQNCFSKAAKYSLFDATKEMAFIPLSSDHKLKGKAAIDGIGSRLGKSTGSCIHQGLFFIFYSISASIPYVAAILLLVISIWLFTVILLGKQFEELCHTSGTGEQEAA
jgi:ATP:ADP antiporter, AAA family